MKTSEFIKYFQSEFCYVKEYSNGIFVTDIDNLDLFYLDRNKNSFNTIKFGFESLDFSKQQKYYKVIFEYLMTPPEEREEEKKYYFRHKGIYNDCLIYDERTERYYTAYENTMAYQNSKNQFTQEEIDNMPECYTHPAVWEKIKVDNAKDE